MSLTTPAVSIVLLNYNGCDHLAACLGSLEADGWPAADVEVIVTDNGSTDGSESFVRANFPRTIWAPTGSNLGFAGGNRVGVERSRGRTLVFLNNDARVERGWLSALVAPLDSPSDGLAAVAGRMTNWDGTRIDYRDTIVTFDGHAFQRDYGRPIGAVADDPPGTERIVPCGGNMAIRREVFCDLGGFDDDFFAYLEDVDLGLRLRSRGWRTIYEPRATVAHRSGATGSALGIYNRGFLIEKNAFSVVYKNWDDEWLRAWLPAVLFCFLHRTERIVRERAPGGQRITVDPYRDPEPIEREDPTRTIGIAAGAGGAKGLLDRVLDRVERRLARRRGAGLASAGDVVLSDPHTLSQLRALHRVAIGLPRLETHRRENLRSARIASRAIFGRWPPALVPTYPGDEELFSSPAFRALLPESLPLSEMTLREVMEF